ncbi:hypothetical protein PC9H_002004 [Pleurotus ostreatus]|uniref:Uncharacterized protein n=1 Tax=Pleurotus ostreatus TaxID=5322 RepID=A0A8H6ZKW6_PLEOS|nr:uncharacterized protein PC9H_002004 [Pleurotus ostreatus]KAF7419414.1 hypothetical protein PC9H_002004 [Pleurotus ostreatus]
MAGFISDAQAKALSQEAEASIWSNDGQNANSNAVQGSKEQQFTIQPHPAKTNDPNDLKPSVGFLANAGIAAHHATGPQIPNQEILNSLEQPLSREELQKRQAELNNLN